MNVLIQHPHFTSFSGMAIFNQYLAIALARYGHHVTVLSRDVDEAFCFAEFTRLNFHKIKIPIRQFSFLKSIFGALNQILVSLYIIISGIRADVYITDSTFSMWLIKLFTSMKCVLYVHYPEPLYALDRNPSAIMKLYIFSISYFLEALSVTSADLVLMNSEWSRSTAQSKLNYYQRKDVKVIYPFFHLEGVTTAPQAANPTDRNGILAKKKSSDDFHFVSVNRFCEFKKLHLIVEAMNKLRGKIGDEEKFRKIKLYLVGGVSEQSYLDGLRESVSKMKLAGNIEFVVDASEELKSHILLSSDAMIYSTYNEHFGLGICEGLEYSLPVIATNSGGPKEIIEDRHNGFLVDCDAESFAQSMLKLVMDREMCREMGKNGRAGLERKYGVDFANKQLLKFLEELS